jgi:UDPglucose--hexose-1-phosphate uridylyltransferase
MLRLKTHEAAEFFDRAGRGLFEVLLEEELAAEKRIIAANREFVAFVPYAAHLAFETWIMPRRAQGAFSQMQPEQVPDLAAALKTVLLKLYVGLDNPDFNLTIDSAPRGDEEEPYFRWHIRVLPRLATSAGFELGSGMSINTVMPEEAAEFLRAENHSML